MNKKIRKQNTPKKCSKEVLIEEVVSTKLQTNPNWEDVINSLVTLYY